MAFTVGELAKLTGVTVRALHHYDEIGLVRPSQRSEAGYRLYDADDVLRLQEVLVLRELGVALPEIGALLAATTDRAALLRAHRARLAARRAQVDALLAAVDHALGVLEKGQTMQPIDAKKMFEGFRHEDYADEARERWGNTDAYQESARRTKAYGPPEWAEIRQDSEQIYQQLAELMQQGAAVADPAVQQAVEAHRRHIDRWFYPCSKQMHAGLGDMYVADPRFAANLDKVAPGFAVYLRDAIKASV
jgi:MerR family transcriptional regulator, thiopeptide resistance regulator